jgi:hypothetical protein
MMMVTTTKMATGGDGDGATDDTSMATTRWRRHVSDGATGEEAKLFHS